MCVCVCVSVYTTALYAPNTSEQQKSSNIYKKQTGTRGWVLSPPDPLAPISLVPLRSIMAASAAEFTAK